MTALHPSAPIASSDGDLLRQTAEGSRSAFSQLVERHRGAVWALVRRLTPNDALAEEALQEAFIAAFRGAAGWSGSGSVRSWLLTLARHATYRHVRRRAGEPSSFEPLDELGAAAGWGQPVPVDELLARLRDQELVRRAMSRLDPDDCDVLVLRDLLGHTGPESAAALGISLNAMKSRLHRSRLRLIAALREEGFDA
ncbi:MAG: RNA polymerase sigma factor [Deltaproteobacteria bacterium]|nr:RNA polymerase sigma factor [Deltaproteobacteria bacterium]